MLPRMTEDFLRNIQDRTSVRIHWPTRGGVSGTLMSHVELTYEFNDIREAAKWLPEHWDDYCKAIH